MATLPTVQWSRLNQDETDRNEKTARNIPKEKCRGLFCNSTIFIQLHSLCIIKAHPSIASALVGFQQPHLDAPSPSASSTIVKVPASVYLPVFAWSVPGPFRMLRSGMDTRTRYGLNAAALVYTAFPDSSNTE